jgi:predicted PurR-regulated permease PerM
VAEGRVAESHANVERQPAFSQSLLSDISTNWYVVVAVGVVFLLGWLVYLLQPILVPFLAGAAVAYLGDPLADRLEARGFSRLMAVVFVFTVFVLLSVLALVIFIPLLFQQLQVVWEKLPLILNWIQVTAIPTALSWIGQEADVLELDTVRAALMKSWKQMGGVAGTFAKTATTSGLAFMAFIANLALIPVVSFYLLKDWDVIIGRIRASLPRAIDKETVSLVSECDSVIASFVRGQLLVMVALGVVYSLGLALVGVDFALLIGMVAGLASIVPYLGFAVGLVSALVVSFLQFQDWLHPLMVIGVFTVGQLLEGTLLTPLLVGDKIGLHPVAVIFAVLAGAQLFGFVGMLLALPIAAVILVVLRRAYRYYLASAWYGSSTISSSGATATTETTVE